MPMCGFITRRGGRREKGARRAPKTRSFCTAAAHAVLPPLAPNPPPKADGVATTGPNPAAGTRAARRPATTSTDPNTDRPRGGRRPGHGPERRSTARRPKDGSLVTVTCRSWVAWQKRSPGWRPQSRAARHPLDEALDDHIDAEDDGLFEERS